MYALTLLDIFKALLIVIIAAAAVIILLLCALAFSPVVYSIRSEYGQGAGAAVHVRLGPKLVSYRYISDADSSENGLRILFWRLDTDGRRRPSRKRGRARKKEKTLSRRLRRLISYPHKAEIIGHAMRLARGVLKALRPKRFYVSGVIGFESPETTGYALACIYVLRAFSGLRLEITGDFERPVIALRSDIRGRFPLWRLLLPIIKFAISANKAKVM
ncbi:MAG: hypothetical protein LBS62_04745 [Clostridiales bacterium]|jgi:hypothetical protein|nr:hypothetical protein [Clostridiales bacterium]